MSYHQSHALAKKYGNLLVEFANTDDTDDACLSFLGHIHSLFSINPAAVEQIKKAFPVSGSSLELPGGLNQKLLDLFLEKKRLIAELNEPFSEINYAIDDFDPLSSTLSMVCLDWERGCAGTVTGAEAVPAEETDKGGFLQTFKMLGLSIVDGPVSIKIDAIKDEVETRLGSHILDQLNELIHIGHSISDLMSGAETQKLNELTAISERRRTIIELHQKIKNIQTECNKLLHAEADSRSLNQNPALLRFLAVHNAMQTNQTEIGDDDRLVHLPPVDENMFLSVKEINGWINVLLNTLACCVVGFFKSQRARKLLRNCQHCQKYFIARQGNQKFCTGACRLAWHNKSCHT